MRIKKTAGRCALALALGLSPAAHAGQTVVSFEEVGHQYIPDGYGGISGWEIGGSVRENLYIPGGQGQFSYGGFNTAPGDHIGPDGLGGLVFDNGPVIFVGTYFFNADAPSNIETGILLYYQGQLVHRIADPRSAGMEWVDSGYTGLVDTLYFASGYDGFMIDNLTYATPTNTVPEPPLPLAVASGLGALGAVRRWGKRGG